jgi:GR25 family glycosyltransferase involved in LPS biosynthesis
MISTTKYTIVRINDRAKNQIVHNKNILKNLQYVNDIVFCNGNKENAKEIVSAMGIDPNTWSPYEENDNRPTYLPGEIGIWVSCINIFIYMIDHGIDKMLVLEDDCLLDESFQEVFNSSIKELPKGWDFLSLYYPENQNLITLQSDIGLKNIHKSVNQMAGIVAMLYSLSGAKKILRLVKEKGIEYTVDCFIYRQAELGLLNGYSLKPKCDTIVKHADTKTGSTIDPKNIRNSLLTEAKNN